MRPLLEKTGVIDDPGRHRRVHGHGGDGVACGLPPNGLIRPRALAEEMEETILRALRAVRVAAGTRCDGLNALPLPVVQDAEEVRRERLALLAAKEMAAAPFEVRGESADRSAAKPGFYPCTMHLHETHGKRRSKRRKRMDSHTEKQTNLTTRRRIMPHASGLNLRQSCSREYERRARPLTRQARGRLREPRTSRSRHRGA